MAKKILIFITIITLLILSACFGNSKKNEIKISKIMLEVDKTQIKANGIDNVKLSVKLYDQNNELISKENLNEAIYDMNIEYFEGKNKLERPLFFTKTPGNYFLTAKIGELISNKATISAISTDHVNNYAITINYGAQYTSIQAVKVYILFTGNGEQEKYAISDEVSLSNDSVTWSSWQPKSDMINWSVPLGDGIKTVYARFKDKEGNISNVQISDTIIMDTNPPVGNIYINNNAEVTTKTTVNVSWNITDNLSGVKYISLKYESEPWQDWILATTNSKIINITTEPGIKRIYAKFMDNVGNISSEVSDTIELVNVIPQGSIAINDNATYTSSQSVTIKMNITGSAMMAFSNDNVNWSQYEPYSEVKNNWNLVDNNSGEKTVYAKFITKYGLEYTTSDSIFLDTDKPKGKIIINNDEKVTNTSSAILTLEATDATSGVADMQFSEDGINWSGWEEAKNTKIFIITQFKPEVTIYARWKDLIGNISEVVEDKILFDNVPPSGKITIVSENGYTSQSSVVLNIDIQDNVSDENNIKMALKNENEQDYPNYSKLLKTIFNWNLSVGEGEKKVYGKFSDEAGNIYVTYGSIIVDNTPPNFDGFIINNEDKYTSKTAVSIKIINGNDGLSGLNKIKIYGDISSEIYDSYSETKNVNLSNTVGEKTLKIKIYDKAGNESIEKSNTIIYDNIPPQGVFQINSGNLVTSKTAINLNMDITDNYTTNGGLLMKFSNDNINFSNLENYNKIKVWNIADDESKVQTVYAQFIDKAGNVYATQAAILLDHTGPTGSVVINNNDNIALTTKVSLNLTINKEDELTAKVSFSNDNVNWSNWENYSNIKQWTLSNGDGEKRVYAKFMDKYGNVSSVVFDTIILDTRPLKINMGDNITASRNVKLTINYPGAVEISFSNDTNNSFDWGPWESYVEQKDWILSDGSGLKKVYMRVRDSQGNIINNIYDDIILDLDAPTGSITINNNDDFTKNDDLIVKVSAKDLTTSVVAIMFSEDGIFNGVWEEYVEGKNYNYKLKSKVEGQKTLYLKLKDKAGNESSSIISATIIYDITAPFGLINVEKIVTNEINIKLKLEANDNITPPVLYMCFSNDGINYSSWEQYAAEKIYNLGTVNGEKKIYVKYKDKAGNESIPYYTVVILDTKAPTGTIILNDDIYYTNSANIKIACNVKDETSSVTEMRFKNYNGIWSNWETYNNLKNWTIDNSSEGIKTIVAEFKDAGGNVFQISKNIYYDTTPPVADFIINNGDKATNNLAVVLKFLNIVESSNSGIEYVKISNNDASWNLVQKSNFSQNIVWEIKDNIQGEKTIYVRYIDKAGNESITYNNKIIFDTVKPTGNILLHTQTTSNASITLSRNIIVEVIGDNDTSGIKYVRFSNDSETWSTWYDFNSSENTPKTVMYNWQISSNIGLNRVYMEMMDNAGNISNKIYKDIILQ